MSTPAARRATRRLPRVPDGERVAAFADAEAARSAVLVLAEAGFPIKRVSIVGAELQSVEHVTGMMSTGRAALSGLVTGIMLGMFAGLVSLIVNPGIPLSNLLAMGLIAVGVGVLWNVLGYLVSPTKRDFTSTKHTVATRFDLVVPAADAAAARRYLGPLALRAESPVSPAVVGVTDAPSDTAPTAGTAGAHVAAGHEALPNTAPAEGQVAPARPRTYGEAQDELKRQQASEQFRE